MLAKCSVVEAKFGLFEKEGKWAFGMPLYRRSVRLGLVPEVLDFVDVVVAIENVGV